MSRRLYRPIPLSILDLRDPEANCRWLENNREEPREGEQINVPWLTDLEEAKKRHAFSDVLQEEAMAFMAALGFIARCHELPVGNYHLRAILDYRAQRIRELKAWADALVDSAPMGEIEGQRGTWP